LLELDEVGIMFHTQSDLVGSYVPTGMRVANDADVPGHLDQRVFMRLVQDSILEVGLDFGVGVCAVERDPLRPCSIIWSRMASDAVSGWS
jgi:hypothetical protein